MKIEIEITDKIVSDVIEGIMSNFPEASSGSALACTGYQYNNIPVAEWVFDFSDSESGLTYTIRYPDLLKAFSLMFTDKWPKGCTRPPASAEWESWDNWLGNADATDFDAFAQLACLGEVIYG